MKAAVLEANEKLTYKEIETPKPDKGEVLIHIAMCGICGSDVPRVYDHAAHNYPIVLGHEFAGEIVELGEGVTGFAVGDHVVAAPLIPCMECEDCKAGNYSLCGHYDFIGSRRNGAMAEYLAVPSFGVVKIDKDIPYEQAATIEPSTVAAHAFRLVDFQPGKSVAVIGCGIIGLYAVEWAKALGASHVCAIGRGMEGLSLAKKLGADAIISTKDGEVDGAYDYVIECSGADATMHLALKIVGKKGKICYVGTPKKPLEFSIREWEQINRKECFVTGSWMSYSAPFPGAEWTDTVAFMKDGRLKFDPDMLGGIYPLEKAFDAFEVVHNGQAKGRVLIRTGE